MSRAAAAPSRATPRDLRAARVQPLPVDERSEYARRGKLAPWQDGENLEEQWVLPAPRAAGGVEVVTLPERGRPQYVGPRHFRDVWEQVRAGLVANALMREGGGMLDEFRPPVPAGTAGDALVTLLLRRRVEHDHDRRMNPRDAQGQRASWPKSTPTRRLWDLRAVEARSHGLQESTLWRPGLPEVPLANGARYLPRWWLWRKTWPGLHWLQRRDPLPVYQGNRGTGQSFIPVHVHEVTPADLPGSLRVVRAAGYVYRGSSTGEDWGHGPTQATATITAGPAAPSTKLPPQWRATVDPLVAEGWSRDWRRVP